MFARWSLILLVATLLWPCPQSTAESYNQFAAVWFINPHNPTWTGVAGKVPPGGCHPIGPSHFTFVGTTPVVHGSRAYFYTQVWGASSSSGPGTECFGDNILLFDVPNTHKGVRGQDQMIYRGMVRPCDGSHWEISTAFRDPRTNQTVISASRATNGIWELWYGTSPDGLTFTWNLLLQSNTVELIAGLLLPHPSLTTRWFGPLTYRTGGTFYTSMMEVDWAATPANVRIRSGSASWTVLPMGSNLSFTPSALWAGRTHTFSAADGRYEAWTKSFPARSGVNPCTNGVATSTYLYNLQKPDAYPRGDAGSDLLYRVVSPLTNGDYSSTGPFDLTSSVAPNPADYSHGHNLPFRAEVAGAWNDALYHGSTDKTICVNQLADWNPWSGSGIRYHEIERVP